MNQIPTVSVSDLADDATMLDVREPEEWAAGHAVAATHIPLGDVTTRLGELPEASAGALPVICRSGGRSAQAVAWLIEHGYDVANVDGGMQAWHRAGKAMVSDTGEPSVT